MKKIIAILMLICSSWQVYAEQTQYTHGVSFITIDDKQYYTSNSSHSDSVLLDIIVTFTVNTIYGAEQFENGDKAYAELRFWENGEVVEKKIIRGNPNSKTIIHRFSNPGNAQVTAKVRNKDMSDKEYDELFEFVVSIKVIDAPATPSYGRIALLEINEYITTRLGIDTNEVMISGVSHGPDTNQACTVLWYEFRFKYKYTNLPYFGIVISPVVGILPLVQCVNYGEKYFTLEQNTEFADKMRQQLRSLGLYKEDPPVYGTVEYWQLHAKEFYDGDTGYITSSQAVELAKNFARENTNAWYASSITGDVQNLYVMCDTNKAHTLLWYQCVFSSGSSILVSSYAVNKSPIIGILRNVDYQLTWNCGLTEMIAHDERIKLRHWHLYEDDVPNPDYPIKGVRISKFNVINNKVYITVELKLDDDWLEYCRRTNNRLSIPIDYSIYACKQLDVDWKCIKPMYRAVSDKIVSEYFSHRDYDIREIWWYKNCTNSRGISLSQIDDDVIRFAVQPHYLIGFNLISLQDYIREGYRFFKVNVCVAKYRYEFYKQFIE